MKDILQRTLKNGDLVVVKPNKGKVMKLGIFHDQKVTIANVAGYSSTLAYKEIYKIENPSEHDLREKEKIKKAIANIKEKKDVFKIKFLSNKMIKMGGIYEANNGLMYIYLGYCRLTVSTKKQKDGKYLLLKTNGNNPKEGHCYLMTPQYEYDNFQNDPEMYLKTVMRRMIRTKLGNSNRHFVEVLGRPKNLRRKKNCELPIKSPFIVETQMDDINLNDYVQVRIKAIPTPREAKMGYIEQSDEDNREEVDMNE